jgi:hypothetical protein
MWVTTLSGDFLNLDNTDKLLVKGDAVIAVTDGKDVVLYSGKSAKAAYKLICDGLAARRTTLDIPARISAEEIAEAKKVAAVKAAEAKDLERKRISEEKMKDKEGGK